MDIFVGRDDVVAELEAQLMAAEDGQVVELSGVRGIGKSRLLLRLAQRAREAATGPVVSIDMSELEIGRGYSSYGEGASFATLHETLRRSRQLMSGFVAQVGRPEAFREYRHCAAAYLQRVAHAVPDAPAGELSVGSHQQVSGGTGPVQPTSPDQLRQVQDRLDEAFVEGWNEWVPSQGHVLLTADNFEIVADDEIGHWFVRTAMRLRRVLTVIARHPDDAVELSTSSRFHRCELPYLTVGDVGSFLDRRFGGTVNADVPAVVHEFTGGHPGGVGLAAELVDQMNAATLTATDLRHRLGRLPSQPRRRWVGLVRGIVDDIGDALVRDAVDAASLVTSFDEPLLAEVMGIDAGQGPLGDVIRRLDALQLLEEAPGILSVGQRPARAAGRWFRLRAFLGRPLADDVYSADPERARHVHERAARRFYAAVSDLEDDGPFAFAEGLKFENPAWQAAKREWLRHSAHLSDDAQLTRIRFLNVFLEVFWWWGCYFPFDLNRRLLEDWQHVAAVTHDPDDVALAEVIETLLDTYPTGYRKASSRWGTVRDALDDMAAACALGEHGGHRPSDEKIEEGERLQAFLDIFLSHTWRYDDPADRRADEHQAAALSWFRERGDHWHVAWLLFEQADLALDRGDRDRTLELLPESATAIDRDAAGSGGWHDHELLADLFRARADVAWERGQVDAAVADGRRAVRHAFCQLNRPVPPDGYTRQFYAEVTTRIAEHLVVLARTTSPVNAALVAAAMPTDRLPPATPRSHDEVVAALEAADIAVVVSSLFPAGPREAELGVGISGFARRWRAGRPDDATVAADVEALITGST